MAQSYILQTFPKVLHFKQPVGTSRGVYTTRKVWYLVVAESSRPRCIGLGECAPLPGLSPEYGADYDERVEAICRRLEMANNLLELEDLQDYSSLRFGVETALRNLKTPGYRLWDTDFSRGERGITTNGLVWMGDYPTMLQRVEEKMRAGFRCIKLKIGAINFEDELKLLRHVRNHFSVKEVELRVDANGAFAPAEALEKLERLAELDLHSIEQPICAGQWEEMARLSEKSPLPIALDEELIGVNRLEDKEKLLRTIHPAYLVLKPSLHGGFAGSEEWIHLSETILGGTPKQPKWWATSALESNIGLSAIAQWCSRFDNPLPQGLGTGQLFTDNVLTPHLEMRGDQLFLMLDNNGKAIDTNDIGRVSAGLE